MRSGVFNFKDGANEELEYEYEKNGNLVKDLNKNISKIEYNLLNLPSKITFGDGKELDRMHGLDWYDYWWKSNSPIYIS